MELLYTDQPLHKNKIEKKSIQKEKVVMIIKEKRDVYRFGVVALEILREDILVNS